jgi:hypothetical protein
VTYVDPAAAEAFVAECERLTNAARELINPTPRATTPAKAQLQRFVMTKPNERSERIVHP